MKSEEIKNSLEGLLDKTYGLYEFLDMLSQVCYEKAEHISTAWQDYQLAKSWESNAKKIDSLLRDKLA